MLSSLLCCFLLFEKKVVKDVKPLKNSSDLLVAKEVFFENFEIENDYSTWKVDPVILWFKSGVFLKLWNRSRGLLKVQSLFFWFCDSKVCFWHFGTQRRNLNLKGSILWFWDPSRKFGTFVFYITFLSNVNGSFRYKIHLWNWF